MTCDLDTLRLERYRREIAKLGHPPTPSEISWCTALALADTLELTTSRVKTLREIDHDAFCA